MPEGAGRDSSLKLTRSDERSRVRTQVEDLVRSIHRTPGLREKVTLESFALPPVLSIHNGDWLISTLLVTPIRSADGLPMWRTPWAAVQWRWSSRDFRLLDLRDSDKFKHLRSAGPIKPLRAPESAATGLYSALDNILRLPPTRTPDLSSLAESYSQVLPEELYAYYWALVSSTRGWLRCPTALTGTSPGTIGRTVLGSLNQAIELSGQFGLGGIQSELEALKLRQTDDARTLAFVGEFNRGKSHLINRLLERNLLPTGVLPTTSGITSLTPSSTEGIEVLTAENQKVSRPLEPSSWSDLRAIGDQGAIDATPTVHVRVVSDWLRSIDATVFDTPGLGDLCSKHTATVEDFLFRCDAVVLVISAKSPLGITEKTFLKDQVLARHVPGVLVAVSMLDLVPGNERTAVLDHIQKKIAQISPDITVLPTYPVDCDAEETVLARIREGVAALLNPVGWRRRRLQQVAGLLSDQLTVLEHLGRRGLEQLSLDGAARAKRLESARSHLESADQEWQSVLIEMDRRCAATSQQFRAYLMSKCDELSELLCFDVMKSGDPKTWWERDFPFRMKREFAALGRRAEDLMQNAVSKDSEWLWGAAQRLFGIEPERAEVDAEGVVNPAGDWVRHNLSLTSLKHVREVSLMGAGAGAMFAYLLHGPAALAIGIGLAAAYGGRRLLEGKINEQRLVVADSVYPAVEALLETYGRETSERLRKLYALHAEAAKRAYQHWLSAQSSVLANTECRSGPVWQALIAAATELKADVAKNLEGEGS